VTKTSWLALLVCVNLVLLTGIVIFGVPPRAAAAQATGLAGNYLAVTGLMQSDLDALYLIDLHERTLHVFYFMQGSSELRWAGYRDLERDFRNNG
jgi:hypothetical protein